MADFYDQQLNVMSITDPLGRASESYTLDANERVTSVTNLEDQVATIDYLVGGFVDKITRFDSSEVLLDYYDSGKIKTVTFPDDVLSLTYDRDGLPLTIANATGIISNEFNEAAWLVRTTGVDGSEINYEYHPAGQIASVELFPSGGGVPQGEVVYSYALDSADRLAEISVNGAQAFQPVENYTFPY